MPLELDYELARLLVARQSSVDVLAPAMAPIVTQTASSTTTIAGGVATARASGKYRYTGPSVGPWAAQPYLHIAGGLTTPDLAAVLRVDFETDAQYVELYTIKYNSKIEISVDGRFIAESPISTDASGGPLLVKLDFGAESAGVRKRINISGFNFGFGGVYTESAASIWYPDSDHRRLMYVFGDSYTQGSGAPGFDRVFARTIADRVGMRLYQDGIGGTGWNSAGSSSPVQRQANRLAQLGESPALICCALGYNDAGGDMGALASSFTAWTAAARASHPAARIVVFGPWTPQGATAALDSVESALQSKCAELGVIFLSIKNFVNSSNKTRYGQGDNVHANQLGHVFLGNRMANILISKLNE